MYVNLVGMVPVLAQLFGSLPMLADFSVFDTTKHHLQYETVVAAYVGSPHA